MKEQFIETRNYSKLSLAFANLKLLPSSAPKMGLGFGNFGLGKTFSLERVAAKENALLFRAAQTWSKTGVCEKICMELGLDSSGQSSRMYERIVESLLRDPRIIIIDEIDALLNPQKTQILEMFRDIHDETGVIVFYIGMEQANAKLKRHKHYYSRIVELVEFENIKKDDIESFLGLCDVKCSDDLAQFFSERYPNLRQIKVMMTRAENKCKMNGIQELDLKTFKALDVE
jgi:DNA transposition AAA+ family ATPase